MAVSWPTARELMTPNPLTLSTDAQLSRALGMMRSRGFHELPVLRRGKLVGMITFDSLARRMNLPLSTKVENLMVLPPIVYASTAYPDLAQQLLAAGMRAAPVIGKKGELIGLVSRTDMVRALEDLPLLAGRRVEEVMGPPGTSFRETEPCSVVFGQIRALEEHPMPVVDRGGKIVGAVGIADLGRVLWKPTPGGKRDAERNVGRGGVLDVEVASIMHSPAVTVPSGTTTGEAAHRMTAEKVSSVFVVDGQRPVGIVSQADLLGLAVGTVEPEGSKLGDVYVQIHGLRGSSDPSILTEIDRVVAKGLRHISRHVRPVALSLDISPQGTHRAGDATVSARLYTDHGIFYASISGWNFFAGIADLLDELSEQTRRVRDESRQRRRQSSKGVPLDEELVDPELEARIRAATENDDR
jgi:CBS-domain-containing membrane protein/ribosome-associated translation inhibitor RaiA